MQATPLLTFDGAQQLAPAPFDASGRFSLNNFACSVDSQTAADAQIADGSGEIALVKRTEISKMKGQGLNCARNATLMSVNLRYIAYAMKEGVVRVISQNGKDMFKMNNTTKSPIMDMATLGTGNPADKGNATPPKTGGVAKDVKTNYLASIDTAGHANIYELDSKKGLVLYFPADDPPQRVIAHPSEADLFITVSKTHAIVWSLTLLFSAPASPTPPEATKPGDYSFRLVDDALVKIAGVRAVLPKSTAAEDNQILDVTISVSGSCLMALCKESIVTWKLVASSVGVEPELQLIQLHSLPSASPFDGGIGSIRIMGNGGAAKHGGSPQAGSHEVLIVTSHTGCDLLVYELSPALCSESESNPIGALLQSIHVTTSSDSVSLSVNTITQDTLVLAFQHDGFVLVLPLAAGWTKGPHCPFPFAQQVRIDESAHQLSVMIGKSFAASGGGGGYTLFMYRAHNFTREKDGLMGCNVVVDEIKSHLIARSESVATSPSAVSPVDSPTSDPPAAAGSALEPEAEAACATPSAEAEAPKPVEAAQLATEAPADASEGDAAFAAEVEAAGSRQDDSKKELDAPQSADKGCDWGQLKQCAASFVKQLEKRRGEMADRILTEVTDAMKASGSTGAVPGGEKEIIDQALVKIREARDVQAASEKNLTTAVKKATETWFEASSSTVTTVLQKELGKVSDGIAATLAQQLSQSRKFCEALAKGVNVKSGQVTKQALENVRPPQKMQETVGSALTEVLKETLGPVFHTELRAHLEEQLCPLIEQRVGEMMSTLRDKMSECLDGIAEQHEQAAKRLGGDLAPVIAKELQDAELVMMQRCSGGSGANQQGQGGLAEPQLEELARCMQTEVVAPLHARIRDLSSQVQTLREEAAQLEKRWQNLDMTGPASTGDGGAKVQNTADTEEAQAKEIERMFRQGKPEDAFVNAMKHQATANHVDFLGRICGLVEASRDSVEDWLEEGGENSCPLSMEVKMLTMLSLARQLETTKDQQPKMRWMQELWFAFEPTDPSVAKNSPALCAELTDVIERALADPGCAISNELRQLGRSISLATKLNTS